MDITYSFMIPTLELFYKACHSYGWAIVLLTIFVRILVYPLVNSSTKNMQRMSQLQPQMKVIQARYKDKPEIFQKKTMEFYQKNKINPMGGCLPLLVQLPILFALFATFTGPPFGDKAIPVTIKVVPKENAQAAGRREISSATSPFVSRQGERANVAVMPGDSTVVAGQRVSFNANAIDGKLPQDFKVTWKLAGKDTFGAKIDKEGNAVFPQPTNGADVKIEAIVPGVAKDESFYFIGGLGKTVAGFNLFKPENWDNLLLIVAFGVTMYLSQKLMVQQPAGNLSDEQMIIQKQTQRTMPIALTAMFFFIPLPSGVFIYMVISNVFQSLQTWFVMRGPTPAIVDVVSDEEPEDKAVGKRSHKGRQKEPGVGAGGNQAGRSDKGKRKGSRRKRKGDAGANGKR